MSTTISTDSKFTEMCTVFLPYPKDIIHVTKERLAHDERRFLEILYAKEIENAKVWARRRKTFVDFFRRRRH